MTMASSPVTFFLVDDDEIVRESIRRQLKRQSLTNVVVEAQDGIEALQILENQHPSKKLQRPYITILDLRMPRMGGLELLAQIRSRKDIKNDIVFILTTSAIEAEKKEAYSRGISGYIVKSQAGEDFSELINMLDSFWRIVDFP